MVLVLLFLVPFSYGAVRQDTERILSFHSDIEIFPNAGMTVIETITVYCAGQEIKRGIYRDFPTKYKDRYGQNYRVKFEVKEVLRDDKPESYHIKDLRNGVRVYLGSENVFLDPGTYTYVMRYATNRT